MEEKKEQLNNELDEFEIIIVNDENEFQSKLAETSHECIIDYSDCVASDNCTVDFA